MPKRLLELELLQLELVELELLELLEVELLSLLFQAVDSRDFSGALRPSLLARTRVQPPPALCWRVRLMLAHGVQLELELALPELELLDLELAGFLSQAFSPKTPLELSPEPPRPSLLPSRLPHGSPGPDPPLALPEPPPELTP